jgi:hypothetical protein
MRADHALKLLSLCLALASACGGDDSTGATTSTNNGEDGGDKPGERDGSTSDSGHDVMSGDKVLCTYDDDDVVDLEAHATRAGLSTATDERGFALLHHAKDGSLLIEAMEVGEPAQPTVRLVAAADAPGRALIASSRSTFAMLWINGDVLSVRLLADGASSHALSSSVMGAAGAELFTFVGTEDGYWAAYAENEGDQTVVRIQAIDREGAPMGEPADIALPDDSEPGHLELARVDAGFLLAYSEPDPDSESEDAIRVVGIALDALLEPRLEPRDEPVVLSKKPAHELAFALDARMGSAGLIFQSLEGGVRPAVKVQRVETDGSAPLDTWNVVSAPRRAQDGSIGAFGQGYAVAYRALSSLGNETPAIRIAFIDDSGFVVHDAELARTTEEVGPTSVRSTTDGKLLVSWLHASGGSRVTRAVQLDCPGALILCGGEVQ